MKKMKVLIVIPAYNEEESLEKALAPILEAKYDYVVINDGSTDATGSILDDEKYNHIDLIKNLGIGGAMQTGYKYAVSHGYDIVVQYDADGQHDVKYIERIVKPIVEDEADMVIGSRFVRKNETEYSSTRMRRAGIKILSNVIKLLSGKRILDTTSGFRAVNRDVAKIFAKNYPIEYPEPISNFLLADRGYRIKEVQVNMKKRLGGKSSIKSLEGIYYAFNVILSIILINRRNDD